MTNCDTSKGATFRRLHERDGAFVIPNPWDIGTARILAALGFEALATTSAGHAYSLGLPEGAVTRGEVLTHCRVMAAATACLSSPIWQRSPKPQLRNLGTPGGSTQTSASTRIRALPRAGLCARRACGSTERGRPDLRTSQSLRASELAHRRVLDVKPALPPPSEGLAVRIHRAFRQHP